MRENESQRSEYMKVRFYVLNEIFHKKHNTGKLLSSRKLAEKFNVSQNTVQRGLAQLRDEGYIINKKGIGNFINKSKVTYNWNRDKVRFIGIIIGDGVTFFYDRHPWSLLSSTGMAIVEKGFCVRHIQLPLLSPDQLYDEIQQSYLDGLVWGIPVDKYVPVIKRLADSGLPVVVYNNHVVDGVNSVITDFENGIYNICKEMIKEGRKKIFMGLHKGYTSIYLKGIKRAFGEDLDITLFTDEDTIGKDISRAIESGIKPDAFFIFGRFVDEILNILDKHKVDTNSECRLYISESTKYRPDFKGYVQDVPFEEGGVVAAQILERMIYEKDLTIEHKVLDVQTKRVNL